MEYHQQSPQTPPPQITIYSRTTQPHSGFKAPSWNFMTILSLGIIFLAVVLRIADASPPKPLVRPAPSISTNDLCKRLEISCVHGSCLNGSQPRCVCNQGWKGTACDTCGGRNILTEETGYITDGRRNYTTDTKCTWLIEGPSPDTEIRLHFLHFATECSWDHVYIYNGSSVYDPQLAAYSGLVIPTAESPNTMPEIVLKGYGLVHFYSDAAYNMSGFNISYTMTSECSWDCSHHGVCQNAVCLCDNGWTGDGCRHQLCPNKCLPNGYCSSDGCHCNTGYNGIDCSIPSSEGYWESLSDSAIESPSRRSSHKHILYKDYLYVFFGYDFKNHPKDDVVRLNLDIVRGGGLYQWEIMIPKHLRLREQQPGPRYGHSIALLESTQLVNKVYMFGGQLLDTNEITSELWSYNLNDNTWEKLSPNGAPYPVVGHSAHIVRDEMIVLFGHNPTYGYLNKLQTYNLTDNKWNSYVLTTGAMVKGGYGHTSVYDYTSKMIYVHAGYVSTTSSTYKLTDAVYILNPITKFWSVRTGSGYPKFLHSATFLNGFMYVFGGNTHNDTNVSQGAKCYSTNFLVYDPICDVWKTLPSPQLHEDLSRFGHIAVTYRSQMYVFGGFDGQVLNDLYRYTPGSCLKYESKELCLYNPAGVMCAWVPMDNQCLSVSEASTLYNNGQILKPVVHTCSPPSTELSVAECDRHGMCSGCVDSRYDCQWCDGNCYHSDQPMSEECVNTQYVATSYDQCLAEYPAVTSTCSAVHNCMNCKSQTACTWQAKSLSCKPSSQLGAGEDQIEEPECNLPCHTYTSCENCTSNTCMWCGNEQRCVESISYVASFPYGQCMEWTTHKTKCPDTYCGGLRTCDSCLSSPACGWCDDSTNTGLGQCMQGGLDGPIGNSRMALAKCSSQLWSFKTCPACQCNGHSQCHNGTSTCIECENNTTGEQCQTCRDGFFGKATNGGNCSVCECNGQADTCHAETGKCYCHTRGVKGDKCDSCDEQNKYYGDPKNGGTCYYNLNTNYKFTFNLSEDKEESKYQTHINFKNEPPESDKDVTFSINCSGKALMNITMISKDSSDEVYLYTNKPCTLFEEKFSHNDYSFGDDSNTTFYVYVYDFKTPFIVEISFLQIDPIDLLHFFITFFSCFLSLLLIAAVVWKVKQKCDLFRRRQRMVVEMEQMASRPFASCNMDIPMAVDEPFLRHEQKPPTSIRTSQRHNKKMSAMRYCPSPITLEPLSGNKAAVLSLLVRLPTGDEEYSPSGLPGVAVASTIVTIGNHRKNSMDVQRPDKNIKPRKQPSSDITGCGENECT